MRLLNTTSPEPTPQVAFQLFRGPEEDFADERRRIGFLVDAWLNSQDESGPDTPAARKVERKLHEAIKSGPLFGKILSFAGLNLWVDARSGAGRVESQESISL